MVWDGYIFNINRSSMLSMMLSGKSNPSLYTLVKEWIVRSPGKFLPCRVGRAIQLYKFS